MIGQIVSHYKIIQELGAGGMGEVYLAEDNKLKRQVALKFLPRQMTANPEAKERFEREAQAAAALNHPNIITIHEIGEHEGQVFIAMEFVEGKTLKEIISGDLTPSTLRPMPISQVIEIATQIASGLAAAHAKGIVHRDIKPQNILIDKDTRVKILDFGLAKLKGVSPLTKEASTLGTVHYMSPEQALGKEVDHRTDIWSLGVVLYEMLTMELPFKGEYDQALLYAVINEEPEQVTALRSGIPLELERLVDKALAKDPAERYQDCQDLIADLRRSSKEAKPDSARRGAATDLRWRRFPRTGLWLIALLAVGVAAAGYLLTRKRSEATAVPEAPQAATSAWANSIAVLPFRDFSSHKNQEYFCDGMTDALIDRLTRFQRLKVISLTSVMVYKSKERNIRQIAQELGVNTVLDGNVQRENDRIRVSVQLINATDQANLWSDRYDRKLASVFEVHDNISQAIAAALKLKLLEQSQGTPGAPIPENMDAYEYFMKGMHFIKTRYVLTFQEEDFQVGVEMFRKALAIDPNYALAYMGLGWAYEHHFHVSNDARDAWEMQKNTEAFCRLDPDSALSNALLGYMYYEYRKNHEKAFTYLRKALAINANTGEVNFLVGMCYLYAGLYEQGSHFLNRAVALDPNYLWAPYKLAVCQMNSGEYEKAAASFEKYFHLTPIEPLIYPGRYLALNLWMKREAKASKILDRGAVNTPNAEWVRKYRAIMLAQKGEKEKALALYRNSEVYSLLGMADEAFRELNKEIRGTETTPYIYYPHLLHNPFYDNLRSDPRCHDLLARERRLHDEYMTKYGALLSAGKT